MRLYPHGLGLGTASVGRENERQTEEKLGKNEENQRSLPKARRRNQQEQDSGRG